MSLPVLIYDRTLADVQRAVYLTGLWEDGEWTGTEAELAEWQSGLKGTYNDSDLNRVETAVGYLADRMGNGALKAYGESLGVAWDENYDPAWAGTDFRPEVRTDWTAEDFPGVSDMERYLGNVAAIRRAVPADYPTLPGTMAKLDYAGANAIEQVLEIADGVIERYVREMEPVLERVAENFVPCGVTHCGVIW